MSMVLRTSNGTVQVRPSKGGIRLSWTVTGNKLATTTIALSADEARKQLFTLMALINDKYLSMCKDVIRPTEMWHSLDSNTPSVQGCAYMLREGDSIFMVKCSLHSVAQRIAGENNPEDWLNSQLDRVRGGMWVRMYFDHLDEIACKLTLEKATQLVEIIREEL